MKPTTQTDFAIIPTRDDIASVEREIRFFPSKTTSPRVLTHDQIASWNNDGYLAPLDVLTPEEAIDYRLYFDDLLAQALAAGKDSYSISSAHMKHARVWDLLNHQHRRADPRHPRRKRHRLGRALLLQNARRRQERRLAPGL